MRQRLGIKTPSLKTPVGQLSGGNQQKTMLAKWLNTQPTVLVLDEPTRGIDVGAKADVHRFIDELARSGIGIILISSDLPEVLAMSDRVAVMREGCLSGIFRVVSHPGAVMAAAVGPDDRGHRCERPESTWFLRPDRVKEMSLLGMIAFSVMVFTFLIDDYPAGASSIGSPPVWSSWPSSPSARRW